MDFVWQFISDPSFFKKAGIFNELEYSIRSVKKNFQGEARYFVVGDKPDVSFDDVIHIPAPPFPHDRVFKERNTIDKLHKMTVMAKSDQIGEEFVLMCDDMFFMKPVTVEDLNINWARQEITSMEEYMESKVRTGDRTYRLIWRNTYEFIKMIRDERKEKTYDWETHTPRVLEKSKLLDILNKYGLAYNPKLVPALYDGYHAHNTQIISADVQTDLYAHTPGMDFEKLLDVQYLNIFDNAIVPEFIEQMKKIFG